MTYILVRWIHESEEEPILLFSELDDDRNEQRKVEIFRGGRIDLAGAHVESCETALGLVLVPPIDEIASSPEFVPLEISHDAARPASNLINTQPVSLW